MSRILFIKPKHIGDSLILTPTLTAVRQAYPAAEIWVAVRKGCEGILAGCPAVDRILTLAPVEEKKRPPLAFAAEMLQLLRLARVKFDYVFELGDAHRGRWLSLFCRAKYKYSVKTTGPLKGFWRRRFSGVSNFDWATCHRVEKDFYSVHEFLKLPLPIPGLTFDRNRARVWEPSRALGNFAVLQIGTRQQRNRWHYEGWREVGKHLLTHFSDLVISTGPDADEIAEARRLQADLGGKPLCTLGQTSWSEVADLFYRARLCVSPSTAALHLAAACQCPSVAVFGPTIEDHWHPWRTPHRIVTVRDFRPNEADSEARYRAIKRRATLEIQTEDVISACDSIIAARRTA